MSVKNKISVSAIIAAIVALQCYAQFTVTRNDGNSVSVGDGYFSRSSDAKSGFTFGGIDIADIKRIHSSSYIPDPDEDLPPGVESIKPAAILDITAAINENEEETRNRYSCEYMLGIAGMPYFVTTSLDEALKKSSLILITSTPKKTTFSDDDIARLRDYVSSGALLFAPNIGASASVGLKELFGVSDVSNPTKVAGRTLEWTDESYPELYYIDEPEERSTSIGSINVSFFTPSTSIPLARFNGNSDNIGVVKNEIGSGAAYLFGLLWRDVIQRPQLDKDMDTKRGKSNTFEPSADVYPLFIRSAYASANPVSTWKYTVPDGYNTVLIPTHDCDSKTALDSMFYLADYEKSLGLKAHYFITTHYFRQQGYMSAFWSDETLPKIKNLLKAGHTVGSHSICHYPDFGAYKGDELEKHFPLKEYTREGYAAYTVHDMNTGISYGSTWAELVLSKRIIEKDLGNKVRSFRSGHLYTNSYMPQAHKIAGYAFSSCYISASVQSEFPFIQRMDYDWTGEPTGTLQIPLHFSDVFGDESMDESNYMRKVEVWKDIFKKNKGNYASSILLVHPNRYWKMISQKMLIDSMDPAECGLYNFEDYGDFWLGRDSFSYKSFYDKNENRLIICADSADIAANPSLAIAVEVHGGINPDFMLIDENSREHPLTVRVLSPERSLLILSAK